MRHRAMLDPRDEDPEGAAGVFFDTLAPGPELVVATYWPKEKEFDPYPILERLLKQGNTCCLPLVQKESRELKFVPWREGDPLEKGPYGVMQPSVTKDTVFAEPDLLIVPLLAFDRRGYRLGYGGGYYDATLRALRAKKNVVAVGVAYARQACLFNLPVDEHDEKLDFVVTPAGAHDFRNST